MFQMQLLVVVLHLLDTIMKNYYLLKQKRFVKNESLLLFM